MKKTELKMIAADKINPPPVNEFKHTPKSIEDMAMSIRRDGLIHPLVVTPTKDGRYEVIAGERRFRALTEHLLAKEIPCHIFLRQTETDKARKRVTENFYRDHYDWMTEARAAWNLYSNGVPVKDLAILWGSDENLPNSMVGIGRWLSLCANVPDDLSALPGGYYVAAASIGAFAERTYSGKGGSETSLPAETAPIIGELFSRALDEGWNAALLLAEAKAAAREYARQQVEAQVQEIRDKVDELAGEKMKAGLAEYEAKLRAEYESKQEGLTAQIDQLQKALKQTSKRDKEQIAALNQKVAEVAKAMEVLQRDYAKRVAEGVQEYAAKLQEELQAKAEQAATKAAAERFAKDREAIAQKSKELDNRDRRLAAKEAAFQNSVDRYAKDILTAIGDLQSAFGKASFTDIIRELSPDKIEAIRTAMRSLWSNLRIFASALEEVGYVVIKKEEDERIAISA